jgi:hypothetical protein
MFLIVAGCAQPIEAEKSRHLSLGDKLFNRHHYRHAIVEYTNTLRLGAGNTRTMRQLAPAQYRLAGAGQDLSYLGRSIELTAARDTDASFLQPAPRPARHSRESRVTALVRAAVSGLALDASAVPEPSTLALFGSSLVGVGLTLRKRFFLGRKDFGRDITMHAASRDGSGRQRFGVPERIS